jgi:prepilin-type N-terminal cleavage/methylation domain-containing protein
LQFFAVFYFPSSRFGTNFAIGKIGLEVNPQKTERRKGSMNKQQGFSLIELLIVVAIIAIIAAIAVPSMLTARMSANEASAIQGCRTIGSAEVAYAAVNNQNYTDITTLTGTASGGFLDARYNSAFNGYQYAAGTVTGAPAAAAAALPAGFEWLATPTTADSTGRYKYGIAADEVVRYEGVAGSATAPMCGTAACVAGNGIGTGTASGS